MDWLNIINQNKIISVVISQYVAYDANKTKCQFLSKYNIDLRYVHEMQCEAEYLFYIGEQEEYDIFEKMLSDKKKQYEFNVNLTQEEIWPSYYL